MNKIFIGGITILLLVGCSKPPGTTVELLKANLESSGGETNWKNLESIKTEEVSTTIIGDREVAKVRTLRKIEVPGFQKEEIYTNDSLTTVKLNIPNRSFYFRFDNEKPVGYTVQEPEKIIIKPELELLEDAEKLQFEETVWKEREVFKLTNPETKEEYIFDKESYFLIAQISETPYGTSTIRFDDYREKEGYVIPFKKLIQVPAASYVVSTLISNLEINPIFEKETFKLNQDWVVLKKGTVVPKFDIPLTGENSASVKNSDLKGKIVLIDFWATWCKPCLKEFPNLKDQYSKYNGKGFEVISVSFDENEVALKQYLEKNDLPWINTWVKEGFKSSLARDFQIASIPKPILIDGNGIVLALDNEATGEKLNETLSILFTSKEPETSKEEE